MKFWVGTVGGEGETQPGGGDLRAPLPLYETLIIMYLRMGVANPINISCTMEEMILLCTTWTLSNTCTHTSSPTCSNHSYLLTPNHYSPRWYRKPITAQSLLAFTTCWYSFLLWYYRNEYQQVVNASRDWHVQLVIEYASHGHTWIQCVVL